MAYSMFDHMKQGVIEIHCNDYYKGWLVRGSIGRPSEVFISTDGYPTEDMSDMAVFASAEEATAYLELNRDVLERRCADDAFIGFRVTVTTANPTIFTSSGRITNIKPGELH